MQFGDVKSCGADCHFCAFDDKAISVPQYLKISRSWDGNADRHPLSLTGLHHRQKRTRKQPQLIPSAKMSPMEAFHKQTEFARIAVTPSSSDLETHKLTTT
jgi:hypothetical protein